MIATAASLLLVVLLAAEPPASDTDAQSTSEDSNDSPGLAAQEPKRGAGVSPVELIPRLELRHSFVQLSNGITVHDTTPEVDIEFLDRMLLRYEAPLRVMNTPAGQVAGIGDLRLQLIGALASNPRYLLVLIAGAVLDTATQPLLGGGKQVVSFGAGMAVKPIRWWLAYLAVHQQVSVAGDSSRPDVNRLVARLGNVAFGKGFAWYKVDLDAIGDFEEGVGRLLGTLEAGRLLVGRVGLFLRTGTQLLGPRQVEYTLDVGVRYLFRLDRGRVAKSQHR